MIDIIIIQTVLMLLALGTIAVLVVVIKQDKKLKTSEPDPVHVDDIIPTTEPVTTDSTKAQNDEPQKPWANNKGTKKKRR
jgi:hypothetical protein